MPEGTAARQGHPPKAATKPDAALAPSAPPNLLAGLPPLSAGRGSSSVLQHNYLSAAQYSALSSSGASTNGIDLLLDSAPGELAWGVYELDITPQISQRWLDLLLSYPDGTPEDEPVWIALADFTARRWELHDVRSEGASFDLSAPRYLSAGQTVGVAVLAWDSGTVNCEGLYLLAGELNALPQADLQADVTDGAAPLTVSFDASGSSDVDGNISSFRWDFDGDGSADEYTTEPLASHSYNGGGTFYPSVTVIDAYSEQDSAELTITVNGGNQSPLAQMQVLPQTVDVFEAVVLDGSASSDPDGSIVNFEWDTDGDGSFETDTDGLDVTAGFNFLTPGVRLLRMRITDDDGATSTTASEVYVRGWAPLQEPAAAGMSGESASLALINAQPAFSYVGSAGILRFVRATDLWGGQWSASVRVSNSKNVSGRPGLAQIAGQPALAFGTAPTQNLRYTRAVDPEGLDWPQSQVAVSAVNAPSPVLLELGSKPGIAFIDGNQNPLPLYFCSGSDSDGSSWSSPLEVGQCALDIFAAARIGSRPALCYSRSSDAHAVFQGASDGLGTAWDSAAEISDDPQIFFMSSYPDLLETVGGRPAVACSMVNDATLLNAGALYLLGDSAGQNWAIKANPEPGQGSLPALAIIDNLPCMAYCRDSDNNGAANVFICYGANSNGTSWDPPIDTGLEVAGITGLQMLNVQNQPGLLISSIDASVAHEYWTYYLD